MSKCTQNRKNIKAQQQILRAESAFTESDYLVVWRNTKLVMSVLINNFNRLGINTDAKHRIKTSVEPAIDSTRPEKPLRIELKSRFKVIALSFVFIAFLSQTKTLLAEGELAKDILAAQSGTIERATADEEYTAPTHTDKLRNNFIDRTNSLNEITSTTDSSDADVADVAEEEYTEASPADATDDTDNLRNNFIDLANRLNEITSNPVPADEFIAEEKPEETIKTKITTIDSDVIQHKPVTVKLIASDKLDETLKPVVSSAKPIITVAETKTPYNKYDTNGNLLDNESRQWACIHDTSNDLMWEVKSKDDALRNSSNLYSWFDPKNKKLKGKPDGGRCEGGTACDTNAYVQAMNEKNFCGHNDWHLPTRVEMQTLVYLNNQNDPVKINKQYFPETVPSWYWTASENEGSNNFAWYVLFRNGVALSDLKERPKHIRLVRNNNSQ